MRALMTARGEVDLLIPAGSGPDPVGRHRVDGSRHRDRHRHLSRLRRRGRGPRQGARHLAELQDPPPERLQCRRDPAGPRDVAGTFLPGPSPRSTRPGSRSTSGTAPRSWRAVDIPYAEATEADFSTEWHSLEMNVRVVDDLDAAMDHIRRHGSGHTEAIVTEDRAAARRFVAEVDAAAVMVNASTRFTDGGEFGFGAEIGISTQKLHARGPMALPELATTKWIVEGDGQTRS